MLRRSRWRASCFAVLNATALLVEEELIDGVTQC